MPQPEVVWTDTPEALQGLVQAVRKAETLFLDTEFHREDTYAPELALVQVYDGARCWLVDPLRLDLAPLWQALAHGKARKVFHAARQDLEAIWHAARLLPKPIFDTQIAAALTGYGAQIGLAELVKRLLKKELPKQAAFLDWRRRPLPEHQRRYAADDVIWLKPLYLKLRDELQVRGRLAWLEEEQAALLDPALYEPRPETLVWRVKGVGKLKEEQLGALLELVRWREDTARALNLPRRRVLPDEALIALAQSHELDPADLPIARWMRDRSWRRHADAIVAAWQRGRSLLPEARPQRPERPAHTPGTSARKEFFAAFVRIRAEEAGVAAHILASPHELAELASWARNPQAPEPDLRVLAGWRRAIVGEDLLRLARGEGALALDARTRLPTLIGSKNDGTRLHD